MKDPITTPGKTYAVTSPNGCTVTQHVGEVDIVTDVPAGQQTLIIAHASKFEIDDDSAIVTECGGSAELVFTAATTRAASSGSGSDGLTSEERALLTGAAQRDADNTFTAGNTFTGAVDMSGASVTPPEGWNVGELTPEAIQQVVPMAWNIGSTPLDPKAKANKEWSVAFGSFAEANERHTVSLGHFARSYGFETVCIGADSWTRKNSSISIGFRADSFADTNITIGAQFTETTPDGNVTHTCTTEGTGSITIGAGANTLNNGDTESSNSVTIGCKAENKGADSVVIGAQASNQKPGTVIIGVAANNKTSWGKSVAIGTGAVTEGYQGGTAIGFESKSNYYGTSVGFVANSGQSSVAIGASSSASNGAVAVGAGSKVKAECSMGFGNNNTIVDKGIMSFAVRDAYSNYTAITKLYIAGANTPLANDYYNGEAFMGYVVTDSAGIKLACGTRRLSELFPDNSLTQPASLDENGEWVQPKVFHPSDLDLPIEELTEPEMEEYQPLPVYPIVEPEIPEMEEV